MKKQIIITLAAAAGILALGGCNKENGFNEAGDITIQASVGAMTKVSYDDGSKNKTSFTAGDQIAVYGWLGSADAVPATRLVDGVANTLGTDGKWTPASQMLWKPGTDAHYFLGVYPVHAITSFTADAYTLNTADYTASDLLIATNLGGVKASQGPVALTFDHAMAKLTVNLKFRSEFGGTPAVSSVTVSAKSTATVDYLTKAVTATGDAAAVDIPAATTVPTGYALSFSGLQVPQEGVRTVTVTIGTQEYVYEAAADIPLVRGQYTTLGLVVGKDKIELNSVSVSDWTAGADLIGGEAVLQKTHESVDMGNGLKWATCNVGAENPEDYGDYFAWGATVPYYQAGHSQDSPCTHWIDGKDGYNWKSYSFMENGQSDWPHITKYTFADEMTSGIWYDGSTFKGDNGDGVEHKDFASYDYADDAARQNWGGNWRTPTEAEWTWLLNDNNCKWEWQDDYDGTGVKGMLVTSKINSNKIFLPAAGCRDGAYLDNEGSGGFYLSSSLDESNLNAAGIVEFYSGGAFGNDNLRYYGQSVRPVTE